MKICSQILVRLAIATLVAGSSAFISVFVIASPLFAQGSDRNVSLTTSWRGEFLEPTQSALYLRVAAADFLASPRDGSLIGSAPMDVEVELFEIIRQRVWRIRQRIGDADEMPREMWKLPSGKYRVRRIQVVDRKGKLRFWTGPKSGGQSIVLARLCLANLGVWTIRPLGQNGLTVQFQMAPNVYIEEGPKSESSIAAVIDGFTRSVQETFGGKRLLSAAAEGYGGPQQIRATVTTTRQIAMFYKLNLFKHNQHARDVASTLAGFDAPLRGCYVSRLDARSDLRGSLTLGFLMSTTTGTMRKVRRTGGTIDDGELVGCLAAELEQILFSVPENMLGELGYTFDVQ